MHRRITTPLPDTAFWTLYLSRSSGILHWQDMDAFWPQMQATTGAWYVFDPREDAPETPLSGAALQAELAAAQTLVYSRRDLPMSGAVYVDNREAPAFIKVFDPANMGSSCSCSTEPVMPRYIFSRARPDSLPLAPPPKTGLFARLTGRS
jgi:hypothetical protein